MHWPEIIRRCFVTERVLYSGHARREMRDEEFGPITDREVEEALQSGEVLEMYPNDTPCPSVLIFGTPVPPASYMRSVPMMPIQIAP
jgi:hypothetical protein